MKFTIRLFTLFIVFSFLSCSEKPIDSNTENMKETQNEPVSELKLQTLMKHTLALAENVEIVVSNVEIPKNTTLPTHFHPGEEFAFLLEGSGTLNLEGKEKIEIKAGEIGMVPFKHHHDFTSSEEGAKMIVFRVHEKGQPERTLIEK